MQEKLSDVGAERAVLSGLLQYGIDAYINISDIISQDSFAHYNNKLLYRCVEHIIEQDQTPDVATLLAAAESLGVSENITTKQELAYIKSLYDFPINSENIFSFAIQIKKFEFARKIKKLTLKIHEDMDTVNGSETINDIVQKLEDPVTDFLEKTMA